MKVVIIGAGLAGLTTAYYLQREGAQVTVIERAAGPGLETSFANGALLHPSFVEPWNSPGIFRQIVRSIGREDAAMLLRAKAVPGLLAWAPQFLRNSSPERFALNTQKNVRLAIYSLLLMQQIRESTPLDYGYQSRGLLAVFRSAVLRNKMSASAEQMSNLGLNNRPLDPAAVVGLEPALEPIRDQLAGGIHYTSDEGGDAHMFCREMSRVLQEGGATLRYELSVDAIHRQGARINQVACNGETITGDAYVLAAGSYSPLLARPMGLNLPIQPAKGYSITIPRAHAPLAAPKIGIVDAELHAAVVPVGDDRIRVAGTAELTGFDLSIRPQRIENLKRLLARIVPRFAEDLGEGLVRPWTGLRPMCADGVPIIGSTPLENLFLNTGHGHLGWTLAAASARLASDAVLGRVSSIRKGDYELARFL